MNLLITYAKMNVVLTLPKHLIANLISGNKRIEMRKSFPIHFNIGIDGFFACEKGTTEIKCWCRIDRIEKVQDISRVPSEMQTSICVSEDYIKRYAQNKKIYFWHIGKCIEFTTPLDLHRNFNLKRAPQSYAYAPSKYNHFH